MSPRPALKAIENGLSALGRVSPDTEYDASMLLNGDTFAVAAVFEAEAVIALMKELAIRFAPSLDITQFSSDIEIVRRVRKLIQTNGEMYVKDLRASFTKEERVRLRDIRWWMQLNGEFYRDDRDGQTWLLATKPNPVAQISKVASPTLRSGLHPFQADLIDISRLPEPLGTTTWRGQPKEKEENGQPFHLVVGHLEKKLLAPPLRHARPQTTLQLRTKFWLLAPTAYRAEGRTTTQLEVHDSNGALLTTHEIINIGKLYSSPQDDAVVDVDEFLNVVVYDDLGREVASFGLLDNPEVRAVTAKNREISADVLLRNATANIERRRFMFTVMDQAFVCNFDGTPVAAWRLPAVNGSVIPHFDDPVDREHALKSEYRPPLLEEALDELGLPKNLGLRQAASYLDSHGEPVSNENAAYYGGPPPMDGAAPIDKLRESLVQLRHDWIYFAKFAISGDSIYLGGHSGLLIKVNFDQVIEGMWWLPTSPKNLIELDSGVWGIAGTHIFEILPDHSPVLSQLGFGDIRFITTTRLVTREQGRYSVIDIDSWSVAHPELPTNIRALYEVNGVLTFETTTSTISFTSAPS
jgi:hypothetical protein